MAFDIGDLLTGLLDTAPSTEAHTPLAAPAEAAAVPYDVDQAAGEQLPLLDDSPQAAGPYADWVMALDTRGRLGSQTPCAAVPWPADEDLIDPDAPPPRPGTRRRALAPGVAGGSNGGRSTGPRSAATATRPRSPNWWRNGSEGKGSDDHARQNPSGKTDPSHSR